MWVTEFGYDSTTKPNHTNDEFKDEIFVTDVQAAQYLTRSYLAFAAMGVDRAYMFYFNDTDECVAARLLGADAKLGPQADRYWATKHLQETLGDYRFSEKIRETAGSLYIHSYVRGDDQDDIIWVLWSPTGTDRQMSVTLSDLPGSPLWAEQMPLADGSAPLVSYQLLAPDQIQLHRRRIPGLPAHAGTRAHQSRGRVHRSIAAASAGSRGPSHA